MRAVWAMVWKDFRRRVRRPMAVLILLAFPLIFSAMIALTFGTGGGGFPKVHLLVQDDDGGLLGGLISQAVASEQFGEYFDVEIVGSEGRERIEDGDASALLIIPENFTVDFIEGERATLELVRNPAQGIMPEVAEQVSIIATDVLSSASRVLRGPLDDVMDLVKSDADFTPDASVASIAVAVNQTMNRAGTYLFPPAISLESVSLDNGEEEPDDGQSLIAIIFATVLPGVSVFALFMLGDHLMRDIVTEEKDGTLRRQLSGPITARTIVLGKSLFTALASLVSLLILATICWFVSRKGVDLLAFALLSLALVFAVTGVASAVYGLARTERQGGTIASIIFLLMAFVGGGFIPLESMARPLQAIAPYTLFYWGTRGFRAMLEHGAGVVEILPAIGVMAVTGAISMVLGSWFLGRKLRRGGAI